MSDETKEIIVGGDKFIRSKKLGSGSFGEIFLGTNAQTRELVAIKVVTCLPVLTLIRRTGRSASIRSSPTSTRSCAC